MIQEKGIGVKPADRHGQRKGCKRRHFDGFVGYVACRNTLTTLETASKYDSADKRREQSCSNAESTETQRKRRKRPISTSSGANASRYLISFTSPPAPLSTWRGGKKRLRKVSFRRKAALHLERGFRGEVPSSLITSSSASLRSLRLNVFVFPPTWHHRVIAPRYLVSFTSPPPPSPLGEGAKNGSGKSPSEGRQLSIWRGDLGVRFPHHSSLLPLRLCVLCG